MVFPTASISSSRLSLALFTTRFTSSSLSSSESGAPYSNLCGFFFSFCASPSESSLSPSLSSSSSDSELDELAAPFAPFKNLLKGFDCAAGFAWCPPSLSEMRDSSSEDSVSESESAVCLKNRDVMV